MRKLILAICLMASPALAIAPGDGVEFTACGSAGRQGVVIAVQQGTLGTLYRVRVLAARAGQSEHYKTVNAGCIRAVRAHEPRPVPELPRLEAAVNGRIYICTPQEAR